MGILSNFIGGMAQAGGEILQRDRESATRRSEAEFASDLDLKKQMAIEEGRERYRQDAEARGEARTIDAEKRGLQNRATERQAVVDETVLNAPKLRDVRVEDAKAVKKAEFDPEIQALIRKAETEKLTAAEQTKLDFFKNNRGAILDQTRSEAQARHIDTGAGLRALQMESERIKIDVAKAEAKLPPAVKGSIASIQKQADAISAAITKAELDGSANPEAVQKYQTRLSELNGQITKLYEPYLSERDRASLAPKAAAGGMQDVIVGGKVIGKAATREESDAMVAAFRKGGKAKTEDKPAPAPKGPAAPPRPLFTRGDPSPNYPGGEIIYNGPTLPSAQEAGGGIIDPKRNWRGQNQ